MSWAEWVLNNAHSLFLGSQFHICWLWNKLTHLETLCFNSRWSCCCSYYITIAPLCNVLTCCCESIFLLSTYWLCLSIVNIIGHSPSCSLCQPRGTGNQSQDEQVLSSPMSSSCQKIFEILSFIWSSPDPHLIIMWPIPDPILTKMLHSGAGGVQVVQSTI